MVFLAVFLSVTLTVFIILVLGEFILAEHLREVLIIGAACSTIAPLLLVPLVIYLTGRSTNLSRKNEELNRAIIEMEQARKGMALLMKAIDTVPVGVTLSDRDGTIIYTNAAEARTHGYDVYEILGSRASMFAPEDRRKDYTQQDMEGFGGWSRDVENLRKDGTEVPVHLTSDVVRDKDGRPTHLINISEDITERKLSEKRLRESLAEKEVLLKEVHHRVKNNLMIVHSLLSLQLGSVEDEALRGLLEDSRGRIKAMSLVHEIIYQNENISSIDLEAYVQRLTDSLIKTCGPRDKKIKVVASVDIDTLGLDTIIPCGLIINELVNNSFKHAFDGLEEGTIGVDLKRTGNRVTLAVTDTGKGLPPGFSVERAETLGMRLVSALVRQIDGTLEVDSKGRTAFNIMFTAGGQGV
jgi:PAS domain S-box-containing protein